MDPSVEPKRSKMNTLEQLKKHTIIVADTGDFEGKSLFYQLDSFYGFIYVCTYVCMSVYMYACIICKFMHDLHRNKYLKTQYVQFQP